MTVDNQSASSTSDRPMLIIRDRRATAALFRLTPSMAEGLNGNSSQEVGHMITRRNFISKALAGVAAGAAIAGREVWASELAWPKPIGLEIYTVRKLFDKNPAETLKQVAAIGYQEVEIGPGGKPAGLKKDLRMNGLKAVSAYVDAPKDLDAWKKSVEDAHRLGLQYIVVGDNPSLDVGGWKRRAAFFNQCGKAALQAEIHFCYHAHFREYERLDGTSGYDIMLTNCDPKLFNMEMDVFWAIYAGVDPLEYWRRYPGRFPLLHIKDMRKGVKIDPRESPPDSGPNVFAPPGRGRIDWPRLFAHVHKAGVKHIFVEQDRCTLPPMEVAKIGYHYLKNLRLG
jgi:sugar phosphate isomerase/epimerase